MAGHEERAQDIPKLAKIKKRTDDIIRASKRTLAQATQTLATAQRLLLEQHEILQRHRASRERRHEQKQQTGRK